MPKKNHVIFLFYITICLCLNFQAAFAQAISKAETSEKVTFIYIPGMSSADSAKTINDIQSVHKYFAGKHLGNYEISTSFKVIDWGKFPMEQTSSALFKDGLIKINSDRNKANVKRTYKAKTALLANPLNLLGLIEDQGSTSNTVFWRNFFYNKLYDTIWLISNPENQQKVYGLVKKNINEVDGKYVLIGNSLGGLVATGFVLNSVMPENFEKFAGMITTGDAINVFYAPIWSSEAKYEKFIKYFVENDKFWISYNHRNDTFTSGLAPVFSSRNNEGKGFIISKISKGSYLDNLKLWNKSSGWLVYHDWYMKNPKEFSECVFQAYDENKTLKISTKK